MIHHRQSKSCCLSAEKYFAGVNHFEFRVEVGNAKNAKNTQKTLKLKTYSFDQHFEIFRAFRVIFAFLALPKER
jgi:hypothetical protein